MMLTHGIFGAGMNWRGIARKLVERRREWGVVLVDLRLHGRSEAGAPPHTVRACAEDVQALAAQLGKVDVLAGHSFGGKVMGRARELVAVAQTWMLDATPTARPELIDDPDNSVGRVLALLSRAPQRYAKRDDFIALVQADGHDQGLAMWLAMNVVPDGSGQFVLKLDWRALGDALVDYYNTDLWASLSDPTRGDVELVIAERSPVWRAEDRARVAHAPAHMHAHSIDAGHLLHNEAPGPVIEMFTRTLP